MTRASEVAEKLTRLRTQLSKRDLDGVLFNQISNTAWITAGGNTYVNEGTEISPSAFLIMPDKAYIITSNIEAPRLEQEEHLQELGFEIIGETWHSAGKTVRDLTSGKRIGKDAPDKFDFTDDLRDLRSTLAAGDIARLRTICRLAAEAMHETILTIRPGDTEFEIAARLGAAGRKRHGSPLVSLIASDERIFNFRHPLPSAKPVERYVMVVSCLRLNGLFASMTRLVHFGPIPDELHQKIAANARVYAELAFASQEGRTMREMFEVARQAYANEGYPEAINEHHQGGTIGYKSRELLANPNIGVAIQPNQAFAWNPSIRGTKVEDTMIPTVSGPDMLTAIPEWPTIKVTIGVQTVYCPAILEMQNG
jgi:Xaa-Pro aminopeptidase